MMHPCCAKSASIGVLRQAATGTAEQAERKNQKYTMCGRSKMGTALIVLLATAMFVALPATGQENGAIVGRVIDAESGRGLHGANVYLTFTTRGVSTDPEGYFELRDIPPGAYELAVSMIGYGRQRRAVQVRASTTPVREVFRLQEVAYDLGEVAVEAERDRRWKRRFRQFEAHFIGTSSFARDTKIANPYVLDFEVQGAARVLRASASEPLTIVNRALGYRVRFHLDDFSYDPQAKRVSYHGLPHFEELTPSNQKERERWKENRATAFRGSLPHLLRSMVAGTAFDEGFQLRINRGVDGPDLLEPTARPFEYALSLAGMLQVQYRGFGPGSILNRKMQRFEYELRLVGPVAIVNVDGHVSPVNALQTFNYPKRVAELLPRDYGMADTRAPGD